MRLTKQNVRLRKSASVEHVEHALGAGFPPFTFCLGGLEKIFLVTDRRTT